RDQHHETEHQRARTSPVGAPWGGGSGIVHDLAQPTTGRRFEPHLDSRDVFGALWSAPMTTPIRRVAVLGAGVMGAGIAAHCANAGIPVLLLDIVPPKATDDEKKKKSVRD